MGSKKDEERNDLLATLECFGILEPDIPAKIEDGNEPPDFYLTLGQRRIAIEVTRFHEEQKEREVEEHWKHTTLPALTRTLAILATLEVSIELKSLTLPTKRELPEFSSQLLSLIEDETSGAKLDGEIHITNFGNHEVLERYLCRIIVADWPDRLIIHCPSIDMRLLALNELGLVKIVETKSGKIDGKVVGQFENWLVIAGGPRTQAVDLKFWQDDLPKFGNLHQSLSKSPFQRVFISENTKPGRVVCWTAERGWHERS